MKEYAKGQMNLDLEIEEYYSIGAVVYRYVEGFNELMGIMKSEVLAKDTARAFNFASKNGEGELESEYDYS